LVYHREAKFKFEVIGVYSPTDHGRSGVLLEEPEAKVSSYQHPVVVGDFNLIRGPEDKNNDNINWPRVHLFNDCIANLALRENRHLGPDLLGPTSNLTLSEVFWIGSWFLLTGKLVFQWLPSLLKLVLSLIIPL
jgi:hypothetical protein